MPEVVDWGLCEYPVALEKMRRLRAQRRREEIPDTLILVEHPPVITVGVQGSDGEEMPAGIPVVSVERGGKSTYHGPGQLVGYPVVDLIPRGKDVRRFVHETEELVVRALSDTGVRAGRVPGRRGVWVDGERKIASVGIAVEEWVTFHGLALNVSNDLAPFAAFHPCGFDGRVMTSVSNELGHAVEVSELKPAVIRAFEEIFAASATAAPSPPETASPAAG